MNKQNIGSYGICSLGGHPDNKRDKTLTHGVCGRVLCAEEAEFDTEWALRSVGKEWLWKEWMYC